MFLASTDLVNLSWSQTFPSIISIVSEFQLIEPKKQAHRYVSHKTSVDQWLSIFYYIKAFRNTQNVLVLTYLKLNWKTPGLQFNYSLDRRLLFLCVMDCSKQNRKSSTPLHTGHSKSKSGPNLSSLLLIFCRRSIHSLSRTSQIHLPGSRLAYV